MDPASVDQTWTYSNICQVGFQQRGGGGGDGEEGVGKLSPRRRTDSQGAAGRSLPFSSVFSFRNSFATLYKTWLHHVSSQGMNSSRDRLFYQHASRKRGRHSAPPDRRYMDAGRYTRWRRTLAAYHILLPGLASSALPMAAHLCMCVRRLLYSKAVLAPYSPRLLSIYCRKRSRKRTLL